VIADATMVYGKIAGALRAQAATSGDTDLVAFAKAFEAAIAGGDLDPDKLRSDFLHSKDSLSFGWATTGQGPRRRVVQRQ
jgi:hypothetical protein